MLRPTVWGLERDGPVGEGRADLDDGPTVPGAHPPKGRHRAVHRSEVGDLRGTPELLRGDFVDWREDGDHRVVHPHVDGPEGLLHRPCGLLHLPGVRHVGGQDHRPASRGVGVLGRAFQPLHPPGEQSETGASPGESFRRGPPDPRGGARDHNDFWEIHRSGCLPGWMADYTAAPDPRPVTMGSMSRPKRPSAASERYPPIADYALIGDCHAAALVSKEASIDWCCLPRFDSGSCFGRLLDWDRGGYCQIVPEDADFSSSRRYVDDTLVLETTFRSGGGEARMFDCFTMRRGGARDPYRQILRVMEGVRGRMRLRLWLCPRFDYAEVRPWIRQEGVRHYSAIGGNDGLLIASEADLDFGDSHDVQATFDVEAGERVHLSIQFMRPEMIDDELPDPPQPEELDRRLEDTVKWWRRWSSKARLDGPHGPGAIRSAIVLKALTNAPTGAIAAAPTTSLPEAPGGSRNWDYRFTWVRDSSFAVRSLAEVGFDAEADGFRRFVERSSAGHADDLQILYGVGGERRLPELVLDDLEGYRGARPVRVGNAASGQVQLDVYGELLDMAWMWHRRGHSPDDDYWRFLVDLVNCAAARWMEPDRGIWETRGRPQHFVHSKAMCW